MYVPWKHSSTVPLQYVTRTRDTSPHQRRQVNDPANSSLPFSVSLRNCHMPPLRWRSQCVKRRSLPTSSRWSSFRVFSQPEHVGKGLMNDIDTTYGRYPTSKNDLRRRESASDRHSHSTSPSWNLPNKRPHTSSTSLTPKDKETRLESPSHNSNIPSKPPTKLSATTPMTRRFLQRCSTTLANSCQLTRFDRSHTRCRA